MTYLLSFPRLLSRSQALTSPGWARRTAPWWLLPLLIYVITRVITLVMIVVASRAAGDVPRPRGDSTYFVTDAGTAPPGYLTTVTSWDGQWYWEIAAHGYPDTLPRDESGNVVKNPWAFFPLYPMVVRAFMAVTGLTFPVAATTLSLLFGAAACLVLYRLIEPRSDRLGALLAVVAVCTFICAPVFHMAYTDSLALLLVVSTLLAVTRKTHLFAGFCLLLLAFTRNVVAAFALFFLVVAVLRWRERDDATDRRVWLPLAALAGWSALLTLAWHIVAALKTGEPFAYLEAQRAWVTGLDRLAVLRFVDLLSDAVGGRAVAALIAAAWIAFLLRLVTLGQRDRMLGAWSAAYVTYILLVTDWNPTGVRYYLLALPVFWPLTVASVGSRRSRIRDGVLLAVVGLVMQWWWIRYAVTLAPDRVLLP